MIRNAVRLLDFKSILCIKIQHQFGDTELPKEKQNLKKRIELMEKEILSLAGNERIKAITEYQNLLRSYSKECGLEEPIYIIRA